MSNLSHSTFSKWSNICREAVEKMRDAQQVEHPSLQCFGEYNLMFYERDPTMACVTAINCGPN